MEGLGILLHTNDLSQIACWLDPQMGALHVLAVVVGKPRYRS